MPLRCLLFFRASPHIREPNFPKAKPAPNTCITNKFLMI